MMHPTAVLSHYVRGRVRIRIKDPVRDPAGFFQLLEKRLGENFGYKRIKTNPLTRSLVIEDSGLDLEALAVFARAENLFVLVVESRKSRARVFAVAKDWFGRMDGGIRKVTGDSLDTSSSVFVILLIHAMREVLEGNLTAPSWVTALWMAFNLYNRDPRRNENGYIPFLDNPEADA